MMSGIFNRYDSMVETFGGLKVIRGKLNLLHLDRSPAKISAGDGLRNCGNEFFEALYYQLTAR